MNEANYWKQALKRAQQALVAVSGMLNAAQQNERQALRELDGYITRELETLELLRAAGASRVARVWFEVSPRGAVKFCGLRQNRYAPTLYQEEALRILAHQRELLEFVRRNQARLSRRADRPAREPRRPPREGR